ncbi:hypothetical protein QWI18_18220 [Pseudomonas sp. W2Oct36]|uniref:hypothetical protein n=1 Tax=Pseudomonas sp. W2Oct36 TaxID=1215284 RepID=UPI0034E07827
MKLPSDRTMLELIYKLYYEEFQNHSREVESGRRSKIYVPIDCEVIAKRFDVDTDLIFGRLYYHLQKKHGYTNEDGSKWHSSAESTGKASPLISRSCHPYWRVFKKTLASSGQLP